MSDLSRKHALFEGLVFSEDGEPVGVTTVGGEPYYIIPDADFRRHVEVEVIDRQVLRLLREQILSNKDLVTEGAMSMLGQEDLFTKALIESSIENIDSRMEELMKQGLPEEVRTWLGMLGFRVVVNIHGELVELDSPSAGIEE